MTTQLVFVTQVIDPEDPVLGFATELVRALEQRADRLVVIANEVRRVPDAILAEVRSLGKERGRRRAARAVTYETILAGVLPRLRPATVLAHMCPSYLTLAAPLVRLTGARSALWYAHGTDNSTLRRAERWADAVLSTFPGTYPRPSPKLRAIGQAIDTARFAYQAVTPQEDDSLRLIALGRTAPSKQYPVMIRAVALARRSGLDARLRIVGPSLSEQDRSHRQELLGLIDRLGVAGDVSIDTPVEPAMVPGLLAGCDALLNTTVAGSGDKAVLEAMACGRPPLASSRPFRQLLDVGPVRLSFREGDPHDLAACITGLAEAGPAVRGALGLDLRGKVEREHSLDRWADEVVRLASALHAGTRSRRSSPAGTTGPTTSAA